jgi:hypothetical protein
MREVHLSQGKVALIDDCDYDAVSRYKWYAKRMSGTYYAARNERVKDKRRTLLMHVFILESTGALVDHKDGNGLNNTRGNIRVCTVSENTRNRRGNLNASSKYKGVAKFEHKVTRVTTSGRIIKYFYLRYAAVIQADGKIIRLGKYKTEVEAAAAYNVAAIKYHKDFARLNNLS